MKSRYFQDYMPDNICFGCGTQNPDGLQIKSYWEGEMALCDWRSEEKYQGWIEVMNGGILATLIDCHCMGTAMADAYRAEGRDLSSDPVYRYATGTLKVKYLKPTPNALPIQLRAQVLERSDRKTILHCESWVDSLKTAEAEVIAIRVPEQWQAHGAKPR